MKVSPKPINGQLRFLADALRLYEEKGNVVSAASTRALLTELEAPRAL